MDPEITYVRYRSPLAQKMIAYFGKTYTEPTCVFACGDDTITCWVESYCLTFKLNDENEIIVFDGFSGWTSVDYVILGVPSLRPKF